MQKQILRPFFIAGVFFVLPYFASAATGDVLFSCDFNTGSTPYQVWHGCGGAGTQGAIIFGSHQWLYSASLSPTGGHDGRQAMSFAWTANGGEVYDPIQTPALNVPAVTIEYWEKYDVACPGGDGGWNMKGVRAWTNGDDYIGGTVSRHNVCNTEIGHVGGAYDGSLPSILTTTSAVTWVEGNPSDYGIWPTAPTGGCSASQSSAVTPPTVGTSYCGQRPNIAWATSAGDQSDTNWHRIRMYVKEPTDAAGVGNGGVGSHDGEIRYWIDDQLVFTLTQVNGHNEGNGYAGNLIGAVSFHPDDDFMDSVGITFNHLYDDITIWEGLFPPGSADTTAPASPSGLSVN